MRDAGRPPACLRPASALALSGLLGFAPSPGATPPASAHLPLLFPSRPRPRLLVLPALLAATKFAPAFNGALRGNGPAVLAAVKQFTQLVQDTSELVVIVFVAWAAINFKDRLMKHVVASFG